MTIKDKMKPRQRCAIANPVVDDSELHPRHHKINGYVQSIMTFEIAEASSVGQVDAEFVARCVGGKFYRWHARASMLPVRHVDTWPKPTIANAQGVLKRLLDGVGEDEDVRVRNGSDLNSIHVYKWATHEEIGLAEKELGHKFGEQPEGDG